MLLHTATFKIEKDWNTGEYGLIPVNAYNDKGATFDAFYNGVGIFHDVWEHFFENTHKYFSGIGAMNIGGETCAMGYAMRYYELVGDKRSLNTRFNFIESAFGTSTTEFEIGVESGGYQFGDEYICNVPDQSKNKMPQYLEEHLESLWKNWLPTFVNCKYDCFDPEELDDPRYLQSEAFRASVTWDKFINLTRYGYNRAYQLTKNQSGINSGVLYDFIEFWEEFCKTISAEQLSYNYDKITFKVYKVRGVLSWSALLISPYGDNYKIHCDKLERVDYERIEFGATQEVW